MKYFNWFVYLLLAVVLVSLTISPVPETGIARLQYASYGCMHSIQQEILIFKKGDIVTARLIDDDNKTLQVNLNTAQIDKFRLFSGELTALKKVTGCTTSHHYILTTAEGALSKDDANCSWQGYDELIKVLFGIGELANTSSYDYWPHLENFTAFCIRTKLKNSSTVKFSPSPFWYSSRRL